VAEAGRWIAQNPPKLQGNGWKKAVQPAAAARLPLRKCPPNKDFLNEF